MNKRVHFTPRSASWMNMVEIRFSILTNQRIRRGAYQDGPELITAIEYFIRGYNQRARAFISIETAERVIFRATKTRDTSEIVH